MRRGIATEGLSLARNRHVTRYLGLTAGLILVFHEVTKGPCVGLVWVYRPYRRPT